jgi:hypothetical protein
MSLDERYLAYKKRERKSQEDNAKADAERLMNQHVQAAEWAEAYLRNRFSDVEFVKANFIFDNSSQDRIGPVWQFTVRGWTLDFYSSRKGRLELYGPCRNQNGCDRIGSFAEGFLDEEFFKAIDEYIEPFSL